MDPNVEANRFWHASLLLSQWDEKAGGRIEVLDNYGFYGLPATDDPNSWSGQLKRKLRLDTDFQGNHGWLRHEEYRFLDRGIGLHGVTFEIDADRFSLLQAKCKQQCADQQQAVDDAVAEHNLKPKTEKIRIYPFEHHSADILKRELKKSAEQNRPARLFRFDLNVTLGLGGPSVATSHTCKSHIISLLNGILDEKHIARLTENDKHPTIPKHSGQMELISLHSEGPLCTHTKKNGEKIDFHDNYKDPIRLFWTMPPQELETESEETRAFFTIDAKYGNKPKNIVGKLQKLEWFFRNHAVYDDLKQYPGAIDQIVFQIQMHYKAFSEIPAKIENERSKDENTWGNWLKSLVLFPPAQNNLEAKLKENLRSSTLFLNMIYSAIVDGIERDLSGDDLAFSWFTHLSVANQKKVCTILERPYLEPLKPEVPDSAAVDFGLLSVNT